MRRQAATALLLGGLAIFASACPRSDRCAKVAPPSGAASGAATIPRCIPLACPAGAKPDGTGECSCIDGATAFFGACMGAEALPAFCGKAARPDKGGCAFVPCRPGDVLERASGVCLPTGSQRAMAKTLGIGLYDDETLGCDGDAVLVARGEGAACAPVDQSCAAGMRPKKDAGCVALEACAAGTVYRASEDRCVRVVSALDDGALVDLAQWMVSVFGPDGGEGTTTVCGPLRADGRFGQTTEEDVGFLLELRALGNEVANAELRLSLTNPGAPESARAVVDRGLRAPMDALRSMGGLANAATATTRVHCPLHLWPRPVATRALEADAGTADSGKR